MLTYINVKFLMYVNLKHVNIGALKPLLLIFDKH